MMRRILGAILVIALILGISGVVFLFMTRTTDITETAQEGAEELEAQAATDVVFRIDPQQSTVTFSIDEVLRGEDFTVVGTTSEVAGDIRVNQADPSASEIGEIRINARDLATDDERRNGAIQQRVLLSAQEAYQFITFEPTALNNMPESVSIGRAFEFQIVGNLTIIDTTNEVTFDATVTPTSERVIEGTAQATIDYNDWSITIPTVPIVASVEDTVIINIDFVATNDEGR